jgi:serine/threonine-protein kinase
VPFDVETLQTIGEPTAVISEIVQSLRTGTTDENTGAAQMSLSASGTLAYLPGEPLETEVRTLVWVDQQGDVERLPFEGGLFWYPRLSPDGLRVATNDRDRILILDLFRGVGQRLPGSGTNVGGWSPDGHRVVFNSDEDAGGARGLFMQRADGSTSAERLTRSDGTKHFPGSWLPDGSALLFVAGGDIFELDGQRLDEEPTTLLAQPFREMSPDPSPDGRWLAYASDESGRFEVYVRAYPSLEGKKQISRDGGTMPAWSKDGRELYYMTSGSADLEYAMMAVSVSAESSFQPSTPRELFRGRFLHTNQIRTYDVAADGRFLMIERGEDRPTHTSLKIVLNWLEELERLVPTDR